MTVLLYMHINHIFQTILTESDRSQFSSKQSEKKNILSLQLLSQFNVWGGGGGEFFFPGGVNVKKKREIF